MEEKAEIPGEDQNTTPFLLQKVKASKPQTDCEILQQGPRLILVFEASSRPIFKGLQIPDAHVNIVLQPGCENLWQPGGGENPYRRNY